MNSRLQNEYPSFSHDIVKKLTSWNILNNQEKFSRRINHLISTHYNANGNNVQSNNVRMLKFL